MNRFNDFNDYNYLCHHGIKGMKWGVRRYQNPDGTLTDAGRKRYGKRLSKYESKERKSLSKIMDYYDKKMMKYDEKGKQKKADKYAEKLEKTRESYETFEKMSDAERLNEYKQLNALDAGTFGVAMSLGALGLGAIGGATFGFLNGINKQITLKEIREQRTEKHKQFVEEVLKDVGNDNLQKVQYENVKNSYIDNNTKAIKVRQNEAQNLLNKTYKGEKIEIYEDPPKGSIDFFKDKNGEYTLARQTIASNKGYVCIEFDPRTNKQIRMYIND